MRVVLCGAVQCDELRRGEVRRGGCSTFKGALAKIELTSLAIYLKLRTFVFAHLETFRGRLWLKLG